jgi:hypothetical protein
MSYNRRTVVLVIVAEARHPHDSESNADPISSSALNP